MTAFVSNGLLGSKLNANAIVDAPTFQTNGLLGSKGISSLLSNGGVGAEDDSTRGENQCYI